MIARYNKKRLFLWKNAKKSSVSFLDIALASTERKDLV
jgi:hypothetical protein